MTGDPPSVHNSDIKNAFMLIVAKRNGLNNDIEAEAFETNIDNESNELSEEQRVLIDQSILKAFIIYKLLFQIIKNPYFINMIRNLYLNYKSPFREKLSNNLLNEKAF